MKIGFLKWLTTMVAILLALPAGAGYWFDASGEVWRSGAGECVRTGYWTPDMIIVGCDGRVAERATPPPAPVARPAPASPPPRTEPLALAPAEETVNFGFDRADLDAEATSAIDTMLEETQRRGSIIGARLTGHADRVGTEAYNLDLSLRRASSVSEYLVRRTGLDPQAIEIGGKGESQPLVACEGVFGAEAIRCLAPNRRVEVLLDVQPR